MVDYVETGLFTIQLKRNGMYWCCSTEHGTGWTEKPKQAFTTSEVGGQLSRIVDNGWFVPLVIDRLYMKTQMEAKKPCEQ